MTLTRTSPHAPAAAPLPDRPPYVEIRPGEQTWSRRLLAALTLTGSDPSDLLVRVVTGAILIPHGLQHLTGAWGGPGLAGTTTYFTDYLQLPVAAVAFVIATELVGGVALLAGLFGRVAAAASAILMIGAAVTVHLPHGFFMNWFGNQAGEGFEYHLLFLALSLLVVRNGSGPWSLDRVIAGHAR